jgi:hypothetical protein
MTRKTQLLVAALVALAILSVMVLAIRATPDWRQAGTDGSDSANDMTGITDALFGPQVIPFEVLGVLLTAIMIGALVTARPLTVHGSEESSIVHPNLAPEAAPEAPAMPGIPLAATPPTEAEP